jgi:hypothetical protein
MSMILPRLVKIGQLVSNTDIRVELGSKETRICGLLYCTEVGILNIK